MRCTSSPTCTLGCADISAARAGQLPEEPNRSSVKNLAAPGGAKRRNARGTNQNNHVLDSCTAHPRIPAHSSQPARVCAKSLFLFINININPCLEIVSVTDAFRLHATVLRHKLGTGLAQMCPSATNLWWMNPESLSHLSWFSQDHPLF